MSRWGAWRAGPSRWRRSRRVLSRKPSPHFLKSAAAAAAETAAGETTATPAAAKAGAAGTARGRRKDSAGLGRHGVQIIHEAIGVKLRAEAASPIPLRRLGIDVGEGVAPVFFHTQGHGIQIGRASCRER